MIKPLLQSWGASMDAYNSGTFIRGTPESGTIIEHDNKNIPDN